MCWYLLEDDCYLYGFEEESREEKLSISCGYKMTLSWYFVTVPILSYVFVSNSSFFPINSERFQEILVTSRARYDTGRKKETCVRLSNSQYQGYWGSTHSPWGRENLYSEWALVFVHSLVRRCAAKLLGLSFSDEKVSLHCTQSFLLKVWQKGTLSCTVLFEADSTFKMQNIQWKFNEIPNLLHSWPTSFFNLKLNVKGYFLENGKQCTMNFVQLELTCSCNWMPDIYVDCMSEVPSEVRYCSCKHI